MEAWANVFIYLFIILAKTPFSYFADWDGFEIMFHVAPLIPSQVYLFT